jgi:probable selenate reductase FAD-binding subunit
MVNKMVNEYMRPSSIREALDAKAKSKDAAYLAGGTDLLAGDYRGKPDAVIDVGRLLPKAIERRGSDLCIGAGATFQDLADSSLLVSELGPSLGGALLKAAVLSMANRNVRNRATVGGNICAARSCSSLLPALLILDARLKVAGIHEGGDRPEPAILPLASWLDSAKGLVLEVLLPLEAERQAAFLRWARTSCDLSLLTAAVSFKREGDRVADLRVAMGGLSAKPRRFPEIESLFELSPLPSKADIETFAMPLLAPRDDARGSAEFKRRRAAALLADALFKAGSGDTSPEPSTLGSAYSGCGRGSKENA